MVNKRVRAIEVSGAGGAPLASGRVPLGSWFFKGAGFEFLFVLPPFASRLTDRPNCGITVIPHAIPLR